MNESALRVAVRTVLTVLADVGHLGLLALRSRARLAAENLFLRKQLALYLERQVKPRRADDATRIALVALSLLMPWRRLLTIVKPDTLIRWHRKGYRLFWKWKSKAPGRPPIPADLRQLIAEMTTAESIVLRSYWVLVVMDQFTRRLVGIGVHCGAVSGADLCCMFNAAIHGQGVPRRLSTDHDPLFEAHQWMANLRILEIDEIKSVPYVPLSHPFVERLIGTMRREFLDQLLFWNSRDLERKLAEFQAYYNAARCHASLDGYTPLTFADGNTVAPADLNQMRWVSHCLDLVQLPVAA